MRQGALYDESFRHQFRSFVRNGLDSVSHCGKMKVVAELLHTLHGDEDICEKIVLVSNSTQVSAIMIRDDPTFVKDVI